MHRDIYLPVHRRPRAARGATGGAACVKAGGVSGSWFFKTMPASVLYVACTDDCTISVFDRTADGRLQHRPASQVAVPGGPMWLATDPRHRYMYCPTLTTNQVLSLAIGVDGSLSHIGSPVPYPDVGESDASGAPWAGDPCPCHVTTDQTGRFLFTAFYTAGMVTVHAIAPDGSVVPGVLQTIQTSHGCHSIQIDKSNRIVYVPCVAALATQNGGDPNNLINGGSRIFQFAFDPGGGLTQTTSSPMIPVRELPYSVLFGNSHTTHGLFGVTGTNGPSARPSFWYGMGARCPSLAVRHPPRGTFASAGCGCNVSITILVLSIVFASYCTRKPTPFDCCLGSEGPVTLLFTLPSRFFTRQTSNRTPFRDTISTPTSQGP